MSASITFGSWREIENRLIAFASSEQKGLLHSIGLEMVEQTREHIDESKAPNGSKWEAWSKATQKYVRRYAPGSKMLKRSGSGGGKLYDRIAGEVEGDAVVVGVDVAYGGIHQTGGKAGRGRKVRIPARPYLGISKENASDIQHIIMRWVEEKL